METSVKDKLDKLLRLLSSNRDGEVLGAVAAIGRVLRTAGLDWHDLADTIAGKVVEVTKVIDGNADARSWIRACEAILGHENALQAFETKFVRGMRANFMLTPQYQPSTKQTNWLVILYKKHVGEVPEVGTQLGAS